jgi:uncharacterized Zn-binding protein involved in type VI secretion
MQEQADIAPVEASRRADVLDAVGTTSVALAYPMRRQGDTPACPSDTQHVRIARHHDGIAMQGRQLR